MRAVGREVVEAHDDVADDDDVKVVLLRGEGGVFSTGADMGNAYSWYGNGTSAGDGTRGRRPSQRRRLGVDRRTFDLHAVNKLTIEEEIRRIPIAPERPAILMHHSPVGMHYASQAGIDLMLAFIAETASEEAAATVQFGAEYYPSARRYGSVHRTHPSAPKYMCEAD